MYSYDEVAESLEKENLSDALYKLRRLAESQNLSDLANWCIKELEGYYDLEDYQKYGSPSYRKVTVFWVYLQTGNIVPGQFAPKINTLPLFIGVAELENFVETGAIFPNPNKLDGVLNNTYLSLASNPKVSDVGIKKVFSHIRRKAREKFHDQIGRTPKRKYIYPAPNFKSFVSDSELEKVLLNRWKEANLAFENGAYLATVILLGSVLEGVLLDKVEQSPARANSSSKSPKDKSGKSKPLTTWTLQELIEVTHDCGWLKKEAKDFSHVVRDYRNFIHPNKERKEGITVREGTCKVIWEVINDALS